jgi:hypothetical protein
MTIEAIDTQIMEVQKRIKEVSYDSIRYQELIYLRYNLLDKKQELLLTEKNGKHRKII